MYTQEAAEDADRTGSLTKIRSDVTFGGWALMNDPLGAELLAAAGFDWICIDCQHGMTDVRTAEQMIRALDACQVPALVRVPSNDAAEIGYVLDVGAAGVIVPMVETAEDALRAVRACRYPPVGNRSWGPVRAALRTPAYTPQTADQSALCFVMVETKESVSVVHEIAGVPGLDGIFVGTADLAISLTGEPAPADDTVLRSALAAVSRACAEAGIVAGLPSRPGAVSADARAGFTMLSMLSDTYFLVEGARAAVLRAVDGLRESIG